MLVLKMWRLVPGQAAIVPIVPPAPIRPVTDILVFNPVHLLPAEDRMCRMALKSPILNPQLNKIGGCFLLVNEPTGLHKHPRSQPVRDLHYFHG